MKINRWTLDLVLFYDIFEFGAAISKLSRKVLLYSGYFKHKMRVAEVDNTGDC